MKKIIFAALAVFALASCNKSETESMPAASSGNVCITFTQDTDAGTRAFFDATAAAETWEKQLSTLSILVFDKGDGSLILRRNLTAAELTAGKITFSLPWTSLDNKAVFYAIANYTVAETVTTQAALQALLDVEAVEYNGTIAQVIDRCKRIGGFTMSAIKEVQLVDGVNDIALQIKRTVAKVALRTTVAADFSERFAGAKIKVKSVEVARAAKQTAVIAPAAPASSALDLSLTQLSRATGEVYDNLFYLFESGARTASEYVMLNITATYDPDGNFGTTGDQFDVAYNVPVKQADNTGAILRNGYYRINMVINGLTGHDCTATITVADWETPVTQDVTLGK